MLEKGVSEARALDYEDVPLAYDDQVGARLGLQWEQCLCRGQIETGLSWGVTYLR